MSDQLFPKLKLSLNHLGLGEVTVDGEHFKGTTAIHFSSQAGDITRVVIEGFSGETVIEADAEVFRAILCPACKTLVEADIKLGRIGEADITEIAVPPSPHSTEWRKFYPSPKSEDDSPATQYFDDHERQEQANKIIVAAYAEHREVRKRMMEQLSKIKRDKK